jgi:dihydroorotase
VLADCDTIPYDSNYKMKPPLRSKRDVQAVVEGLANGTVEVIATDHAPHAGSEKMQEFERCPFGITGLETAIVITLERVVHTGRLTLERMIEAYTVAPARILGLDRGTLRVGAAGDITVFDLTAEWTYDVQKTYSKSKNSPFHGVTYKGGPRASVVAGEIVWQRA